MPILEQPELVLELTRHCVLHRVAEKPFQSKGAQDSVF
jgi:hypothetical protein